MARTGRPSELTPENRELILKAVRTFATREAAAIAGGVDVSTLYRWLAKGKKKGKRNAEYRDFREALLKAEAEAEVGMMATIQNAARRPKNPDWKALAWILERRRPKKYGRRDHHTLAGDKDAPAVFTLTVGELPGKKE